MLLFLLLRPLLKALTVTQGPLVLPVVIHAAKDTQFPLALLGPLGHLSGRENHKHGDC